MAEAGGKASTTQRQSGVPHLLCRHSGCRAGRHNALRSSDAGEQSNVAGNQASHPGGSLNGPWAIRARVVTCVSLARHGTPPRAREVLVMESFLGRAWRKQRPAAAAAKKKSSGGLAVLVDERFNELGDLALLVAGQLAGPLEHLAQLACRTFAARLCGVAAKDIFDGDMQS